MIARTTTLTVAFLLLAACNAASAETVTSGEQTGEVVSVRTTSGRIFRGTVHADSNFTVLKVASRGTATSVVRSIPWSCIESVSIDSCGTLLTAAEARSAVHELSAATSRVSRLRPADFRLHALALHLDAIELLKSYAQQALELLQ